MNKIVILIMIVAIVVASGSPDKMSITIIDSCFMYGNAHSAQ
jgi:hypothetical protein